MILILKQFHRTNVPRCGTQVDKNTPQWLKDYLLKEAAEQLPGTRNCRIPVHTCVKEAAEQLPGTRNCRIPVCDIIAALSGHDADRFELRCASLSVRVLSLSSKASGLPRQGHHCVRRVPGAPPTRPWTRLSLVRPIECRHRATALAADHRSRARSLSPWGPAVQFHDHG